MRHALQIGHHRQAADIFAQRQRQRRIDLVVGLRFHDLSEGDDLALLVRDLKTHHRLARDDLDDANADGRQRTREILGERADLARLNARRRS